jgi:hypothetical protein
MLERELDGQFQRELGTIVRSKSLCRMQEAVMCGTQYDYRLVFGSMCSSNVASRNVV